MKSSIRTFPLLALTALLLLAPGSAAAVERTVSVRGTATQEVPNDTASLRFSVSKERRSRTAALHVVSSRLQDVIAAVQGIAGVGSGDLSTGTISVREVSRDGRTLYRAA